MHFKLSIYSSDLIETQGLILQGDLVKTNRYTLYKVVLGAMI